MVSGNIPTAGNASTPLNISNELNLDKIQTKEVETLKSNKIDAKSDQTSIPSSACCSVCCLSVTVPKTDPWRSRGNINLFPTGSSSAKRPNKSVNG